MIKRGLRAVQQLFISFTCSFHHQKLLPPLDYTPSNPIGTERNPKEGNYCMWMIYHMQLIYSSISNSIESIRAKLREAEKRKKKKKKKSKLVTNFYIKKSRTKLLI